MFVDCSWDQVSNKAARKILHCFTFYLYIIDIRSTPTESATDCPSQGLDEPVRKFF